MMGALRTMKTTKTTKKAMDRPLKLTGRNFTSVSDLVHSTTDVEFSEQFDQYQADRRLINCLTVIRCTNEVSQSELADRMECAQSKVSKMESSVDIDLNFGDIVNYAKSLKQSIHITFSPSLNNGADHIRFHIECVKHELKKLVSVSSSDQDIANGVEAFAIERVQDFVESVSKILDRLPHRADPYSGGVSVEAEDERGKRLPLDRSKRTRKSSKSGSPVG